MALVLDLYKSSIIDEIKQHAKELNTEFIYASAYWTGTYQPLDIQVFGVVKEKLQMIQQTQNIPDDTERYELIYKTMKTIWNKINNNVFKKAWEILGLQLNSDYDYELDSYSTQNYSSEDESIDLTFQPTEDDSGSSY